jgi:parallel beta-helix repeat protein
MELSRQAVIFAGVLFLLGGPAWSQENGAGKALDRNVRRFGAVGDGKTDDTAALQRAVDSGGGVVRLPKGVYRITRPVVIELDKVGYTSICGDGVARIVMAGPGPALKFVGTHLKSADPENFTPAVWERQRMPLVDAVAIEGAHLEAVGIEAAGTMELTLTRLHIRGVLHCIHLVGSNRNLIVSDCHLYENRGVGVFYDNVSLHQSNIVGCHISYNRGGGIVSRAGNVRNIQVTGCDLESNMAPDAPPTANVLIDCSGSPYGTGEVAVTGCTIQHNHNSPDSANIRILGRSQPSARLALVREGNITITGNVLSDVEVNVHLRDCRGVTLTGNTFWMGFTHNLLIEDCSDIVLGPNNFDRNPRYDYGNSLEARNSLVVRNSADCTLSGLHVNNVWREPAGLSVENCRRMNITNCTILDCDNVGLLLTNVSDSRVSDCLIRDDRAGASSACLVVTGGRGNMIVNNLLGTPPRRAEEAAHSAGNVQP